MEIAKKKHTACHHCGEDCIEEIPFDKHLFCCNGCSTVYDILNQNGLCNYYDLENNPGIKIKSKFDNQKFSYLSNTEIANQLVDFIEGESAKVTFFLPQIHCSSCIWLVENLNKLDAGVVHSSINFLKKEASISFNPNRISLEKLVTLLASIGYEPDINLNHTNKTTEVEKTHKALLLKLGIAGFCFGNVMLFSFPDYLGLTLSDNLIHSTFSYLSILLSLPVFIYCSSDYYKSAYQGLKQKHFNIDVPVSIGIITLFSRSAFEILSGTGSGYLDSLTGLVFFLLIGKWYQSKVYKAMSFERDYKSYFPISITVKENDLEKIIPLGQLKKGTVFIVRNNELIPCDAILQSPKAKIDYSFVTGEADPITKTKGEHLFSGGKQMGSSIELQATKEVSQSYLTQLWNQEAFTKNGSPQISNFVDSISPYFTFVILSIAIISAIVWYFIDSSQVVTVFTAVLIVACPCALALSLPFSLGTASRILGKKGFYLKDTSVIEQSEAIDTLVFDKTGTITLNKDFDIKFIGKPLSSYQLILIKSLTKHSTHPLSVAIHAFLQGETINVTQFEEIASKGIQGVIKNHLVKIGSDSFVGGANEYNVSLNSTVFVSVDEVNLGYFSISKKIRPNFKALITHLQSKYELHLLSGDNAAEKELFTPYFKAENIQFKQSPIDKLNYIKKLEEQGKKVMMLGDGLNDAGALKQSSVGVAICDDIYSFTPASDLILNGNNLHKIANYLTFAHQTINTVKWCFGFSFFYNISGLILAVTGNLSPLFAAVLMPLSSVSVVLFATLATTYKSKKLSGL